MCSYALICVWPFFFFFFAHHNVFEILATTFYSFLLLSSTPLFEYISLFIHLLVGIWVVFNF